MDARITPDLGRGGYRSSNRPGSSSDSNSLHSITSSMGTLDLLDDPVPGANMPREDAMNIENPAPTPAPTQTREVGGDSDTDSRDTQTLMDTQTLLDSWKTIDPAILQSLASWPDPAKSAVELAVEPAAPGESIPGSFAKGVQRYIGKAISSLSPLRTRWASRTKRKTSPDNGGLDTPDDHRSRSPLNPPNPLNMASADINPCTPPQHTRATHGNDPEDDVFTPAEYAAALRSMNESQWPSDKLEEEATKVMRINRTLRETQEAMEGAEDWGPIKKLISSDMQEAANQAKQRWTTNNTLDTLDTLDTQITHLSDKVQQMGEAIKLKAAEMNVLDEETKALTITISSRLTELENNRAELSTLQANQEAVTKEISRTLQRRALQNHQKRKTATPHCETTPL